MNQNLDDNYIPDEILLYAQTEAVEGRTISYAALWLLARLHKILCHPQVDKSYQLCNYVIITAYPWG